MLPYDYLFVKCDTYRKPESNTNFLGKRKHMFTMIPSLHTVESLQVFLPNPFAFMGHNKSLGTDWLFASPASSQPSPFSITHQQQWTTDNHKRLFLGLLLTEIFTLHSPNSVPHVSISCFWNSDWPRRPFFVWSDVPVEPKEGTTSPKTLIPLFCKNRASSLRVVSKSQPSHCWSLYLFVRWDFLLSDSNSQN